MLVSHSICSYIKNIVLNGPREASILDMPLRHMLVRGWEMNMYEKQDLRNLEFFRVQLFQGIFTEGRNQVFPLVLHSSEIILSGLLWIFEETVFGCVVSVGPGQRKDFHSRSGVVPAAAQCGFHGSVDSLLLEVCGLDKYAIKRLGEVLNLYRVYS